MSALVACLCATSLWFSTQAHAKTVLIVAVGADNVYGHGIGKRNTAGVDPSEAFPAQLQTLLRARGIDVHVSNAGVPRENDAQVLARLDSSVPKGTRLVIVVPSKGNDKKSGIDKEVRRRYLYRIEAHLRARHIAFIKTPNWKRIPGLLAQRAWDGHHFTAKGHAIIARYLLPKVIAKLGGRRLTRR